MKVSVEIDDKSYQLNVPEALTLEAREFFDKMDRDMNCGWQMSRWWVPDPDQFQRCQIVADRVLGAFHTENKRMVLLMSGYILSRVPHVQEVVVDTSGDITLTEIIA